MRKLLIRVATGCAVLLGVYLIGRAIAEPFVIAAHPSRYADDWGGPSLIGVLAVHMLPGVASPALLTLAARRAARARRGRPDDPDVAALTSVDAAYLSHTGRAEFGRAPPERHPGRVGCP